MGSTDEIFRYPGSKDVAQFVGMENILSGSVLGSGSGHSRLAVGSGEVLVPAVLPRDLRITIGIPADCITITPHDTVHEAAGMNIIGCYIGRVTCGRDMITVQLEGPVPLIAVLRRSEDSSGLFQPGKRVSALFRPADVHIFSGD